MPGITALCLEASRIAFEGWLTWQGRGSINERRAPSAERRAFQSQTALLALSARDAS